MPRVALDLGHTATGLAPAAHAGLSERRLVWRYALAAADALDRSGEVTVAICGHQGYTSRQSWAAAWNADLYLACHVNAGWTPDKPARGALFHTRLGVGPAEFLADALAPLTGGIKLWQVPDTEWASNPYALVQKLGAVPGVVLEPGYIDCPEHAHLWQADGPERLGKAIAAGVLAYLGVPGV